jgi:7-cyano-7-deazaguanosine (preQ0) biosynthesis protein QueE
MEGQLLFSELFGPTIQGEGPSAGRPAVFLRVGACNLACRWCDTAYTWDAASFDLVQELAIRDTSAVVADVLSVRAHLVVITGGEPGLQASELAKVAGRLRAAGRRVEVETSGSVPLGELVSVADSVVVSPKLSNSGLKESQRLRWKVLDELAAHPHVVFKFVVADADRDLDEVGLIVDRLKLSADRVWIMPEARDAETLIARMQELAQPVAEEGWSLSSRLQILLWGNERGH